MKYFYTVALALLIHVCAYAQVIEKNVTMSLGNNNAFIIDLPGADKGLTENLLKKHLKDYGKFEKNKKAKEFYIMNTRVPAIGASGQVSLFFKITEGKDMSSLTMWVDNGSSFVSSDEVPSEANGAEVFLTDFSYVVSREVIRKQLEDQEKALKDLEKDLSKLEGKNSDYHEDIEKANQKIAEAEQNIEQNLRDQDAKREEIEKQKQILESVAEALNNVGKNN